MFKDIYREFIQQQLNELVEAFRENTGIGYDVEVTDTLNYSPSDEDKIFVNIILGPHKKIEGSPKSLFRNFSITVWSEKNHDGSFTRKLFEAFFDAFSMKSIKLSGDDEEYAIFQNFNGLLLNDSRYQSGAGYRCKYILTGQLIYSDEAQIGRHTYIAFPTSSTTDSNVVWNEVEVITPSEARDNNMKPTSTNLGIAYIVGNPSYSGSLGLIFKNDDVCMDIVKYIHRGKTINSIWIKYEYQDYTAVEKKLKISNASVSLDENTKNTVITMSYVKDDVYGI